MTRRVTRIVLLTATILLSGLMAGTLISRADVPGSTTGDPTTVLALVAVGEALVVALVSSQNAIWTRRTDEYRQLDRLKDEFIQNVAHELRTPVTLVRGYVEMLAEEQLDEETRRHAAAVAKAKTEALVKLVETITTLHEVRPDRLNRQPVDLAILARTAVQMAQQKAHRAGVRVLMHVPPDLPRVSGDPFYLIQALAELLNNAIKFSPNGGVINVCLSAERKRVRVEVTDRGIGIPAGELKRIFDRFYQVDGSTTRRFGGIGLGLSLVRAIVEAHNGHVWATSEGPGRGSTFVFTVPVRAAKRLARPRIRETRGLQERLRPRFAAVRALLSPIGTGRAGMRPSPNP